MDKLELARKYRINQYIDFGDLNEKAEQQIEQAFIDGFEKAFSLFGVMPRNFNYENCYYERINEFNKR